MRCWKQSEKPLPRSTAEVASGRRCTVSCYEIRVTGPGRGHYRLFCRLDNGTAEQLAHRGFDRRQIAVIDGMVKPNVTEFSDREYRKNVRDLGRSRRSPHVWQVCNAVPPMIS